MDFVSDRLADGRWFRILTVVDQYTRECLCVHAERSQTGKKVAEQLSRIIAQARSDGINYVRQWQRIRRQGDGSLVLSERREARHPGPDDGGEVPADWVAVLSEAVPLIKGGDFVNKVDAALAEIRDERAKDLRYVLASAKLPLGVITPKRDMIVTKRGRTTRKTKGKIIDIDFRTRLTYPGVGKLGFTNQVLCERYTDGGDSGSLVIDVTSGKIVGLHFAGAEQGSVFNPIGAVMKALNFTFTSR